jgi:protein involved in polysaccharide export with SLBB domain
MTVASIVDDLNAPAQLASASAANTAAVVQHNTTQGVLDLENGPIDFHHVRILRDGKTLGTYDVIGLRAAGDPGPTLLPNDTVALSNKPIAIDVSGDVERPGMAYLNPGEPLSEAITQVGGLNDTSTESDLWLNRDGKTEVVSMGAPEFAMPAQPGDRIVVPRATRVDVLGNVEKPGDTLLRGTPTLVGAIYYAGGPAKYANLKAVSVIHNGVRKQYNLAALQHGGTSDNPTLADGDVVMVPQGSTFEWQDVWSGLGALGFLGLRIL